jgi:hypothetical protein
LLIFSGVWIITEAEEVDQRIVTTSENSEHNKERPSKSWSTKEVPKGPWTLQLDLVKNSLTENSIRKLSHPIKPSNNYYRGYIFFKSHKVKSVLISNIKTSPNVFIKSTIQSSYRTKQNHKCVIKFDKSSGEVKNSFCNCKCGQGGKCSHVFAVLWLILDHINSGQKFIKIDNRACTELSQSWGTGNSKKSIVTRKFSDLLFVKHKPNKTSRNIEMIAARTAKRSLIKAELTSEMLKNYCKTMKDVKKNQSFCYVLEKNHYEPIAVHKIVNNNAAPQAATSNIVVAAPQTATSNIVVAAPQPATSNIVVAAPQTATSNIVVAAPQTATSNIVVAAPQTATSNIVVAAPQATNSNLKHSFFVRKQPKLAIPVKGLWGNQFRKILGPKFKSFKYSKLSLGRCRFIQNKSKKQGLSNIWDKYKKLVITSTKFFPIINRKKVITDCFIKYVFGGVGQINDKSGYLKQGLDNEKIACIKYKKIRKGYEVFHCGLCINPSVPILGTSPDRIVKTPSNELGLLEIKTLCKAINTKIPLYEAIKNKVGANCLNLDYNKGFMYLKRNSPHFYQVQGQMAITGLPWCDYFVDAGSEYFVERIMFDEHFWTEEMLPKLVEFYHDHFPQQNSL